MTDLPKEWRLSLPATTRSIIPDEFVVRRDGLDLLIGYEALGERGLALPPEVARFLLKVLPEALGVKDHGPPVSCSVCDAPLVAIAKSGQDLEADPVVRHYAPCECFGMPPGERDAAVAEILSRADALDVMDAADRALMQAAERFFDIYSNDGVFSLEHVEEASRELREAVRARRSIGDGRNRGGL